jgi:phosphoribosyl 1,2-cyclic phosphodiesterase
MQTWRFAKVMRFSVLSSGSKANATYIEGASTHILIDCGLSMRRIEERLGTIGVDAAALEAILITHEHSDHILGVERLSKRHRLPVYCNKATSHFLKGAYALEIFETGSQFSVGEFEIAPVSIVHDAADPVAFIVKGQGISFAQATDTGRVTPLLREALTGCHSMVLESNHDRDMLWSCSYPWELKQRISSSHGHLSNDVSAELLTDLLHDGLNHVVLGHLSENSNTPEKALKSAQRSLVGFENTDKRPRSLRCANVYEATPLMDVAA